MDAWLIGKNDVHSSTIREQLYAIILFTMGEYCSRWSEGTFSLNLAPKVPRDLVL